MRKVELRMNEEYKYITIKKLVETNGNKKRAATKLKRSIRQIDRLIAGYKAFGKEFFVHGNRNRKPSHALSEEQRKAKTMSEKAKIQEKIVTVEEALPRQPRCQYFGEELQMDACIHPWFGDCKTALHAAIDNSTGNIVGMYFDTQETLNGYYNVTHQILTNYGLQQRLPQEFRLANITNLKEANEFLKTYINRFNQKFALCINNNKSVFKKQPDKQRINLTLSVLAKRVVDSGHSIKFKNKYYRFTNVNGSPIYFHKGTKCMVIEAFDGEMYATVDNSVFALEKIPSVQSQSVNFDEIEITKEKKKYIPRMTHPCKLESFESFVEKQEHRLENVS